MAKCKKNTGPHFSYCVMKVHNGRSMDHFRADERDVFAVKILVHTSKLVKWSILLYYNRKL